MSKYLPKSDPENESEEERFYESLDRILSSSNSSTPNSEDDNDAVLNSNYCRRGPHRHGSQNYDVWFSIDTFARSSVEQRRDRLLQVLGMSSDASVLRSKNDRSVSFNGYDNVGGNDVNMSSSISSSIVSIDCVSDSVYGDNNKIGGRCGGENCNVGGGSGIDRMNKGSICHDSCDSKNYNVGGGSGLGRMKKDTICYNSCDSKNCDVGGGSGFGSINMGTICRHDSCDRKNCNVGSGSGLGCFSKDTGCHDNCDNVGGGSGLGSMNVDTICHDDCDIKNCDVGGGSGLGCMNVDAIYCGSYDINGNAGDNNSVVGSSDKGDVDAGDGKNCNVGGGSGLGCANTPPVERKCEVEDKVCMIKNLDNGKEFVVKEVVGENGMWNKVKEVGTGKQLTMEEFEMSVGHSPIVLELMRRQNVNGQGNGIGECNGENESKPKKKKLSWLRSIKKVASSVTGYRERRSSDEKDTSSEKGARRSSSATDDSQESSFHGPERVRVRQYGKSVKDLTGLYKSQEIQAHNGSIWTTKFSLDGRYLASAGEDCVIHVWQVVEVERKGELLMDRRDESSLNLLLLTNGSPEVNSVSLSLDSTLERKKGRVSVSRKSVSVENIVVPDTMFGLSDKPVCSFQGHSDDVLDLSWSKSKLLLSSSMDKTVRLWNLTSKTCVKIFSHSDYVTCIQFNPVDDRYFISGSLDTKVRIWSIPDHQVVDWNDLHEMVTAACYTPDGQGALAGSYKGTCRVYNTSENKLQQKCHINLQNKKKKSHLKKITGFQFAPGSSSEVLITSADSRVRVVDGADLVHKFKGFRNTNSQISASLTSNGKYIVCASEDSHVYVWKHDSDSRPGRSKGITITRSYEHFHCQDVSVAIPWPGMGESCPSQDLFSEFPNRPRDRLSIVSRLSTANRPPTPVEVFNGNNSSPSGSECSDSPFRRSLSSAPDDYSDRISATWPEEKLLLAIKNQSPRLSLDFSNRLLKNRAAWGLVIVTAGLRGEIRTFQNFGMPVRI